MFATEILEKIFEHPDVQNIPIDHQSTMIKVIGEILEESGVDLSDAVSEYES